MENNKFNTHRKIRSSPRLLLRLIRIVNQRSLLPVQHEPPPRPPMERGTQLVQISSTGRGVHCHMRTQINLVPGCLNVLLQIQVRRHDGKVSERAKILN